MDRRDFLEGAATVGGWGLLARVLGRADSLMAQPALGPGQSFDWDQLKAQAHELATQPFEPPGDQRPPQLAQLSWDQYDALRFRPDHALWADTDLPFRVRFFHLGSYYHAAVRVFVVDQGEARAIEYDPSLFDYGQTRFDPPLPHDLGFAGWRLYFHTNFDQDIAVFLGASYFRATDAGNQYGMSCRGLAIDTALGRPEEFPRFSRFWLVRPQPTDTTLTAYALLESESVTGAYRFGISPGGMSTIEVTAQIFPRKPIERLGIAPMTSMFWFGENERRATEEWREEIHDSDGLSMWRGNGEWVWRPLTNPPTLQVSSFLDENPRGFGLLQRDRDFVHYQDEAFRYERRPSVWIEPLASWGKGRVLLVEIPTSSETDDNIVAFWQGDEPTLPGARIEFAYRIHWGQKPPVQPTVAICVGTRIGRGGVNGFVQPNPQNLRKFVVDFAGGDLALLPHDAPIEPVINLSRGKVEPVTSLGGLIRLSPLLRPIPEIGGWRCTFDISWEGTEPIDIRLFLRLGPSTLTETWLYLWTPPHG